MKKQAPQDKKKHLRETDRLTAPPRLEGKRKNAKAGSKRGKKQKKK